MTERRHLELAPDRALQAPPPLTDESAAAELAYELELPDDASDADDGALLYNAAGVRIDGGRLSDHDAGDAVYRKGDRVGCEISPDPKAGIAWGVVVVPSRRILVKGRTLPRIVRRETGDDTQGLAKLRAREQALWAVAKRVVHESGLPVKVVRAEAIAGGQRLALYFASEEKSMFRDLLRVLAPATRERVEVRQIGLRDAAKVIGGVGPCGLQLCCNTFLSDFAPVSIKMAKDQGLGVNPQKLSGVCGRLLCCLVYEEAYYRAQRKLVPRPGERVTTKQGDGRVRDVDVLQMQVRVVLDSGELLTFEPADVTPVNPRRDDD
jgi:cell fate regulator YaaT (PSP1 superfamily)